MHSDEGGEDSAPAGTSFRELIEYLGSDAPEEIDARAVDGFSKHIFYDFDVIKRYMVKKDSELSSIIGEIGNTVTGIDY